MLNSKKKIYRLQKKSIKKKCRGGKTRNNINKYQSKRSFLSSKRRGGTGLNVGNRIINGIGEEAVIIEDLNTDWKIKYIKNNTDIIEKMKKNDENILFFKGEPLKTNDTILLLPGKEVKKIIGETDHGSNWVLEDNTQVDKSAEGIFPPASLMDNPIGYVKLLTGSTAKPTPTPKTPTPTPKTPTSTPKTPTSTPQSEPEPDPKNAFSVYSHNVLASPYTKFNSDHHGNGDNKTETKDQKTERYRRSINSINEQSADVVCLQECEPDFWVLAKDMSLDDTYTPFRNYTNSVKPGTVILLKNTDKGGKLTKLNPTLRVNLASYPSKSAICLQVKHIHSGKKTWIVNVHLPFDGEHAKRVALLKKIKAEIDKVTEGDHSVVLVGDFNASTETCKEIEKESWIGELQHVDLGEDVKTGLNFDFTVSVCVDHMYITEDLKVVGEPILGGEPGNPYGPDTSQPATIIGASDHVWIKVTLE